MNQAGAAFAGTVDHLRLDPTPPVWRRLRGYALPDLRADVLAGATVALVSIPQAIGFALITGLPPQMVIASVVVGGFIAALFTTSHHMVFGPSNSMSLLIASAVANLPALGLTAPHLALLLACLIGVFQLAAGFAKLGRVTQYISRSVVVGYGTAIGALLAAGQLPHLLGTPGSGGNLIHSVAGTVGHVLRFDFNLAAIGIGITTLLLFHVLEKAARWIPSELVGLVLIALFTRWTQLGGLGVRTISDEGALTGSLPSFIGLPLEFGETAAIPPLLGTALAIAILGMLEAVSIGKTLAARSGQRIDANQELLSMGFANLGCSAFGAMPGSASFARSAANIQSGARSQVSALTSSLMVLGALFFVAPLINFIPVPALAAHLIRIGCKMINREQLRIAWRATRSDATVLAVTLLAAFLFKLDTAIYVGLGLSLVLFLKKASAPSLVEYGFNDDNQLAQVSRVAKRPHPTIAIVHVEGELFFGAADLFHEEVRLRMSDEEIRVVILRMKNARHLDATTAMALLQLRESLLKNGRSLLISGINPDAERVLRRSGAWDVIGGDNIFPAEANLTMSTKRALMRAKQILGDPSSGAKFGMKLFYDQTQETRGMQSGIESAALDYCI